MVMKNGKAGMFGPKDHGILRNLFLCRYLTAVQIATLHYNSVERARTRLSQGPPGRQGNWSRPRCATTSGSTSSTSP